MAVSIATIFAVIGYSNTGLKFFDNVNSLTKQQFNSADALIRDIHEMVVYQADKTLLGKIDVKFQRLQTILENWEKIDKTTKKAFAKEILEGDGSVDNAIWRFHNSVYAPGGFFEVKSKNILNEKYGPLGVLGTSSTKARKKLKKFFPTFLEVEMKATTLIYFGYYVQRLYSKDKTRFRTEIRIARDNSKQRIETLDSKIKWALNEVAAMHRLESSYAEGMGEIGG